MKKAIPVLTLVLAVFSLASKAQSSSGGSSQPVQWSFSAKKTADKSFEVIMVATVQSPWHIYSQTTPDGGPLPTKLAFDKNPMITLEGPVKESGKIIKKHEEVFGIDVLYFEGNVSFVQTVTVKVKIKTKLNGSLQYMTCNDTQCLPPVTVPFSIPLQ